MAIPEHYNSGFNLGVGGAVVLDDRLLFVRRASRRGRGNWQVPGGYVEREETIEEAVRREVAEEAGVQAEALGVVGLRNRYDPDTGNSMYVVMLMRPLSGDPRPDNHEVDRAEYFTLEEIQSLSQVPPVNLELAQRVLAPDRRVLSARTVMHFTGVPYTFFVG